MREVFFGEFAFCKTKRHLFRFLIRPCEFLPIKSQKRFAGEKPYTFVAIKESMILAQMKQISRRHSS